MRNHVHAVSCEIMRKSLASFCVLCCVLLAACDRQSESSACLNNRSTVLDIIYEYAAERADALAAANQLTRWSDVRAELKAMRVQNLVQMTGETLDSFDTVTGKANCGALLRFVLPAADKTSSVAKFIAATDPSQDVDVLSDDPRLSINYTVEPDASNNNDEVVTVPSGQTEILVLLAMARVKMAKGSY